jgi:hypothetical protein
MGKTSHHFREQHRPLRPVVLTHGLASVIVADDAQRMVGVLPSQGPSSSSSQHCGRGGRALRRGFQRYGVGPLLW